MQYTALSPLICSRIVFLMAKTRTKYICQQCGGEQSKWVGRCPDCGAWNTMEETVDLPQSPAQQRRQTLLGTSAIAQGTQVPLVLPQIKPLVQQRISVGYAEMDRVLGGGLVAGSLTLIGGEPGIGKSTLLLQVSGAIAKNVGPVLYVSGEESIEQVKMRAERLDISGEQLYLLASIELDVIAEALNRLKPALGVVDSIQTVLSSHLTAAPGSIPHVREGTRRLLVEVQALVTPSNFGNARCTTNGIEYSRLLMLLAVLTKRVGLAVGNHDVYANVVGGFTLEEPAIDLGVAAAIASSYREKQIPRDMVLIGEVGLSGELRAVSRLPLRVREAAKLGFKRCIIPSAGRGEKVHAELTDIGLPADFKVLTASSLAVALEIALH